jgi:NAD(P)-dependent dehydrogenase (short-subunit alcohol dehydrogenase family)
MAIRSTSDRLAGRVAIITGAAQGIGATLARAYAAHGAAVCACDVRSSDAVVAEIAAAGGRAAAVTADVTNPGEVATMVERVLETFGRVDVLVNNAALFGTLKLQPFWEIDSDEWDRVMAVNTRGSFECVRAVLPAMRAQSYGRIINLASGTVFKGTPLLMHYVASKGAVVAMTRAMARELGEFAIGVNAIAPGLTESESVLAMYPPALRGTTTASRCFRREQTPDDLIGAAIFLGSAESDFMTGQVMVVDGGSVMP